MFTSLVCTCFLSFVLLWCCPRPGVTRGQGWASHRCHATGLATPLVSPWSPRCGGFPLARMGPRAGAPSLPRMQGSLLQPCTCMCPPVPSLAILFLGFVLSYFRQTLFHHGAANSRHGPLGLCWGATALPDQTRQCRLHMPDNWGRTNPNLHVDNFILGNKDCEIGRFGFQLPNAPNPRNRTPAPRTARPDLVR